MKLRCQERAGLRRIFEVEVPENATIQNVREGLAPLCKGRLAGILLFDGDEYLQNKVPLLEYEIADGHLLLFEVRMCGILPADHDWSQSGLKTKPTRFAF
jgi:hypothetical protein